MGKHKQAKTSASSHSTNAGVSRTVRRVAMAAFAFSGMAALIYEVVWTRELSLVFGSTVYAVSMMLASFMSGLSLGAFLGGKWADKSPNLSFLFGKLEFGVGIFGLLTIPLIQAMPTIYFFVYDSLRPSFVVFFVIQMLLSFLIMLVPTTFMGATFPVVTKLSTQSLAELGADVGDVYSINTLGSIAGSLAAGFMLIPLIGVKGTTFVAAALNVVVASIMVLLAKDPSAKRLVTVGAVVLAVIAGAGVMTQESVFAHNFYRIGEYQTYDDYLAAKAQAKLLFHADDVHGSVEVFEDGSSSRKLQNSGKIEGSDSQLDRQTTSLLALLPMYSSRSIDEVLIVGLGTGLTSKAALDAGAGELDTVEINRSVADASRYFVGDQVANDPRAEIHFTDARNYLFRSGTTWDVISSEPSYPLSTHVSHLFTREFYQLVDEHLADGGAFCQWIPRYLLTDEDTLMMLKTFVDVFPNSYVWGSNQGADEAVDMMLIGIKGDTPVDTQAVESKVRAAAKLTNLDFALFATADEVRAATADPTIPLNTDDRPLLEFRTPRNQIDFYRAGVAGLKSQK
ncbi:MAG: hypothetical protein CVT67_11035 [Actinobacteria bacterium HGW-Actinobacteria-7]|jgi:predicted membrane-bound spermidine synthase|nr:MAG: hypothetical protein CVT67_11035 [Actinobacteria bacterium HGW-Actinobacteria-7]